MQSWAKEDARTFELGQPTCLPQSGDHEKLSPEKIYGRVVSRLAGVPSALTPWSSCS